MSLGVVALVGLAATVASGPAQETLVWDAPPACPGVVEVRARLARLLGDEASPVRAEAHVQERAPGWQLDLVLHWRGHGDVRTIVAERCETLADAAVLLVAATGDPVAVLDRVGVEPPSPQDVPATRLPTPREATMNAPPPTEARSRPRDRGPFVSTLGLVDLGSLARLGAGLGAAVGWRWKRARVFAEGSYLPARRVVSDASYAREGRMELGAVRMGGCGRPWLRSVEVPLCGGIEAGGLRATGFGVSADRGTLDPWLALFAHGSLVIPLMRSLAVVGRVELGVPLVYSELVFGDERLYRARPVSMRAGLGLEFRWGQRKARRPENLRIG